MERCLAAFVLIGLGVGLQWGAPFGLIVLGALVLFGGHPAPEVQAAGMVAAARGTWLRVRRVAVAMPRRTTAAGLVSVAALTLPIGAMLAVGAGAAALLALGSLTLVAGVALGWE